MLGWGGSDRRGDQNSRGGRSSLFIQPAAAASPRPRTIHVLVQRLEELRRSSRPTSKKLPPSTCPEGKPSPSRRSWGSTPRPSPQGGAARWSPEQTSRRLQCTRNECRVEEALSPESDHAGDVSREAEGGISHRGTTRAHLDRQRMTMMERAVGVAAVEKGHLRA